MRILVYLFLWLSLAQCTTLNYQIAMGQFRKAVALMKENKLDEAEKVFTQLCTEKHGASCLAIGRDVGWYAGTAIMQGATFNGQAKFVISSGESDQLTVFAYHKVTRRWVWPAKRLVIRPDYANSSLTHVEFSDLKVGDPYVLVVLNQQTQLLDFRDFSTLATQGHELKVAVASCMRDDLKHTEDIWMDLENRSPDVIFMIGDNTYADIGLRDQLFKVDAKRIWRRHMETRNKLRVFRWKNLIPVFGIWDDHDYGKNNGGKEFPARQDSEEIFQQFFITGVDNKYIPHGPGLSFSFKMRGNNFVFLDNRSFRDTADKKEGFHFGRKQNQWLGEHVSDEHLNWLISGDQFFGGYHSFESFQGNHPEAFKAFISKLKETRNRYVFISGDRHLSEVMAIPSKFLGYPAYEITSSAIHSSVYDGALAKHPNPYRKHGVDGKWNYVFLTIKNQGSKVEVKYESRGLSNSSFFRDEFEYSL